MKKRTRTKKLTIEDVNKLAREQNKTYGQLSGQLFLLKQETVKERCEAWKKSLGK